jgi:flagellar motor component MotA
MFGDITTLVNNYVRLKEELKQVEGFLKQSMRVRLEKASQEDILETIIHLLDNQKSIETIKLEEKVLDSDAKDFAN